MSLLRAKFKNEIIAEFLPPKKTSNKVIIFCPGMPSSPDKEKLLKFFSKKNYWIFSLRYRGTWESDGDFLKQSPHLDILDVIDELPKGFKSLWDGVEYKVNPEKLYLFGSSFGGSAVILAGQDQRVDKVVAMSPVIDWAYPSEEEPLDTFGKFVQEAYGGAYRFQLSDWEKLATGEFYNPIKIADKIDGSKILIFHAQDDKSVDYHPSEKFAKISNCKLILRKKGGHFSGSKFMKCMYWWRIRIFLSNS